MEFSDIIAFLPILLKGALITVQITIGALLLSTLLGLLLALMKLSPVRALSLTAGTFINVVRGLPIIVQLFYIYFVLPELGIQLSAFQASIIGLGVAYSAYQAENFRAGIEAIEAGQIEAARSIGMKSKLIMRRVVLPQAIRIALPPYGNHDSERLITRLHHHRGRNDQGRAANRRLHLSEHHSLYPRCPALSLP